MVTLAWVKEANSVPVPECVFLKVLLNTIKQCNGTNELKTTVTV